MAVAMQQEEQDKLYDEQDRRQEDQDRLHDGRWPFEIIIGL